MPDEAKRAADQDRSRDAIERRAGLIVGHRFVVVSISATLIVLAFACAIVMRIFDSEDYPTLGRGHVVGRPDLHDGWLRGRAADDRAAGGSWAVC